jgi:hypothetical protein
MPIFLGGHYMQKVKVIQVKRLSALLLGAGLILGGCSNNGGSSSGGSSFTGSSPLTIDSAGVVPVIGDNSTTSVIYVHNNTNQTISGIKYGAQLNTGSGKFLDSNSTGLCASIPAGQSCPLSFTTPVLSKTTAQGSALLTASYSYKNETYQFSQTLSFGRVDDNTAKGALFNSGVELTSAGNDMAYGTVYIYGSGQNKVYTVDSISSNKGGVQIIQGNISGKQLQSNYVSALEVSAPTDLINSSKSKSGKSKSGLKADGGFNATLTALSSSGASSYTSTSNVGVAPVSSGAILTVGDVPIINSSVESATGTLYITNAGNQTATLGTISFPAGVSNTSTGTCGGTLAAGAGCSINFSVTQAGGNGNITVNYTGGSASSVSTTVTWYNSVNEALVQMVAAPNPLTFSATVGGSTAVTLSNIGGYNLSNVTTSQTTTSGSATATVTTPLSCMNSTGVATGTNLPVGGSCTYSVRVSDNATDIGKNINLGISGTYNNGSSQTYSRILALGYTSNQYAALLSVPNITMATIVGNNTESTISTINVVNNGEAPAVISSSIFINNPAYLTMTSNGCANITLNPGISCPVTFKLGPTTAQSQLSGTATYNVTYSGGQTPTTTTPGNVGYTVQANNQSMTMGSVITSGGITGTGASGAQYQIGGTLTSPTITLTYQNTGSNPVQVSGISNTNSPIAWQIDTALSTCYSGGNLPSGSIAPGAPCTIVFKNVLAEYAEAVSGGVGATFTENLTVPTLVFQDMVATGTQFQVTPSAPAPISGNTIYAQGNQATLVNNVSQTGSTVTVTHSLANAAGYAPLIVVSKMEDYFTGTPSATNCTTNGASGVMTETCTLSQSSGTATASVVYTKNPNYSGATLHVLFDLTTSGYVVSFTPLSAQITLN